MRFKKVYIEITNICNLNCSFCAINARPSKYMSTEEFTNILKEIHPYTKYIYLHVLGEPLLHPKLKEFLQIAKEYKLQVNLTSNCVRLKQSLPTLLGTIRQLNMSLHSQPNQTSIHEHSYIQDCLTSGDILASSGVYISYRLWNMKFGRVDHETKKIIDALSQHYHLAIEIGKKQKLADRRFLHFEEEFIWPSMTHNRIAERGTCYGMRDMCAILVDGSVVPCCLDSKGDCVLGNIYISSFADIITNTRSIAITEGFQQRYIAEPLCQRCGYRTRFDT